MTNQTACINMIKQQLRTSEVLDETILNLYQELPREAFVPSAMHSFAYSDTPIAIGHEQFMLTPVEEAKMLQALSLKGHETVLEIGTGTGFFTALLSRLCRKVISVDYFQSFTDKAKSTLDTLQISNVELITADGSRGLLDKAPYDVVVFTGALESISETHQLQVLPGGKLCAIIGHQPVMRCKLFDLDHQGHWQEKLLFETYTPLLVNPLKATEFVF